MHQPVILFLSLLFVIPCLNQSLIPCWSCGGQNKKCALEDPNGETENPRIFQRMLRPDIITTYQKKSEIWPRTTLGRIWGHWADIWDIGQMLGRHCSPPYIFLYFSCKTFQFSHAIKDFWVRSCKIRLSGFLIKDKTFCFYHPR